MASIRRPVALAETVEAFTDGACSGNPGPGGWGVVLRYKGVERELSGGEAETTNNRMELMAAIAALETMKRPVSIAIHTDSMYVRDGMTKWLKQWKARGWKTADRKPVKNDDLWRRLDERDWRDLVDLMETYRRLHRVAEDSGEPLWS